MSNKSKRDMYRQRFIGTVFILAATLHTPWVVAQGSQPLTASRQPAPEQNNQISYGTYILGPGDVIGIELVDIPEMSGKFEIGPDGTLYLPRLRAIQAEGMTIDGLQAYLTDRFRTYLIDPQVYVRPLAYRAIRVYVGGEVKRPGYYTLSGEQRPNYASQQLPIAGEQRPNYASQQPPIANEKNDLENNSGLPTIFDAIQSAQGITPYSDLSKVQVIRRNSLTKGGGRKKTYINFLSVITEGDDTQNIRLIDGDMIKVGQSPTVLRDQLLQAGQTNLTPQFLQVFISGRVEQPGSFTLPQGSTLVHAVDIAGGPRMLHGRVEFVRLKREGEIDRRIFGFKRNAPSGSYNNPVLSDGDVIRVRDTVLSKSMDAITEITTPAIGIYSAYSFFQDISN